MIQNTAEKPQSVRITAEILSTGNKSSYPMLACDSFSILYYGKNNL